MKPTRFNHYILLTHALVAVTTISMASMGMAAAVVVTKAGTGTELTDEASWTDNGSDLLPEADDIATWDSSSLGGALTVASDVSWGSINISDALSDIGITGTGIISSGNITLTGSRTVSIANPIALSGNSTYSIADATNSAATDATLAGGISGSFGLSKSGAGTLNLNNSTFTGSFSASAGVTTLTGASSLISGATDASVSVNGAAVLRQSAGTLKTIGLYDASSGTGTAGGQFMFGSGSNGNYELSDGTLQVSNPWRFTVRNGQITQTGGTIVVSYVGSGSSSLYTGRQFLIGENTYRGVVYSTGGSTTFTTSNIGSGLAALCVSDSGTGGGSELTLAGTANWSLSGNAGFVSMTRNSGDIGNLNLNGSSVLTTNQIIKGSGTSAYLNFNGGTLKANADHSNFLTGLTAARIYTDGAKIDTNGKNITIGQALVNPSGNMVTDIEVASGGSGYTAAPIVSISGGGGTGATAIAHYDQTSGAVTSITITNPGSGYTSDPTISLGLGTGGGSGAALGAATLTTASTSGGLSKLGLGTLTLSSASTYAGTTTVNAGTLLVNNASDSATGTGTVTVKDSATLGGTGAVSGDVILEPGGSLAPGTSIESLGTGALTLPAGATLKAEINSSGSPATDVVNVSGTLTLGGALDVTDIAVTPAAIPLGSKLTLITYTAGTPTGTFTDKAEGSSFAVGSNTFKIRYADSNAVTLEAVAAASSYSNWANNNAPSQTSNQDYDQDGVSNGIEYVLGGLATANDLNKLPTISTTDGNFTFRFKRDQASKTPDTAVSIEVGSDLLTWPTTYIVGNNSAASTAGVTVTDNLDGTDTVTLTLTQAPDSKKFARLVVTIR